MDAIEEDRKFAIRYDHRVGIKTVKIEKYQDLAKERGRDCGSERQELFLW